MMSVNPLEVVKGDCCGALKSSCGLWSDSGPIQTPQVSVSITVVAVWPFVFQDNSMPPPPQKLQTFDEQVLRVKSFDFNCVKPAARRTR